MVRLNPNAIILDAETDHAVVSLGPNINARFDIVGHEFESVSNQISDCLLHHDGICANREQRSFDIDLGVFGFDFLLEGRQGDANDVLEFDDLRRQFGSVEAAKSEQIKNELVHAGRSRTNTAEVVPAGFVEQLIVVLEQFIAETADGAKRGTKYFVR